MPPCPRTTATEPSSELTNDLPATGTTAQVENAPKPLEQTDKPDLESTTQLDNELLQNDSAKYWQILQILAKSRILLIEISLAISHYVNNLN